MIKDHYFPPIDKFNRFTLGLDNFIDSINLVSKQQIDFPKYNIYNLGENKKILEIALAGYSKEQLSVEIDNGCLVVTGNHSELNSLGSEIKDYIHKGISRKNFQTQFALDKNIEVKDVVFESGMLTITLEKITPEELKPKRLEIK